MTDFTEFANSLKGIAMMALQNWKRNNDWCDKHQQWGDSEIMSERLLKLGRCQAYATILRHITGMSSPERWQESVDAISPVTVRQYGPVQS